ncbi:uncharacterized protein LOC141612186 [Silene latifolia]|uniref:uncharacterized protein LOC141612186 n=1 Tax=Silene latifolia TaxID=37657 RepID=UPI003D781D19
MRTANQQNHQNSKKTASLFSCAFFRQCTESPLSPTPPHPSPPHLPPTNSLPPPRPRSVPSNHRQLICPPPAAAFHHPSKPSSSSSSSSSSTSQSFTQWRFPPTYHHPTPPPAVATPVQVEEPTPPSELIELYHMAEVHFTSGSDSDHLTALHVLERILVPNPPSATIHNGAVVVPETVMNGVILHLREHLGVKPATKVLLALCLADYNRQVAIGCGAPARVLDVLPDLDGSVAERALAALDLMCTVPDGAAQVRSHALAIPMLVEVMGRMEGRGREYAISVLAAVYSSGDLELWAVAPVEEVARAVMLAMQQGECSARGMRKGAQLLKVLQENGRLDLTQ